MATAKKPAAKKPATKKPPPKKPAARAKPAAKGNYTDPELREKLKEEIKAGDKGGKPGQWSARKAQLLAHEYEAQGGGYEGPKTGPQEHLGEWTKEEWQTADGEPADRGDGGTHRYLPRKAWGELTDAEKKETDVKKVAGSKAGKQFVGNTPKAKAARKSATAKPKPAAAAKKPASGAAKKPATKRKPVGAREGA